MEYENVLAAIEKPNYKEKTIKKYQGTNDIIKDLVYCFRAYQYQARPIAKHYGTGNLKTDAKVIYDYIKKNIRYKAEPEGDQTTRSFSRIQHDGWGDCKHTALTVGSIGWNEGYNVIFRVVRYKDSRGGYLHHVYTLLQDTNTGETVIVDPLQDFNYEKEFDKKIGDFKAKNNMTLTRLTGIPQVSNQMNTAYQLKHQHRKPGHHAHKHNRCAPVPSHLIEGHEIHGIDTLGGREIILTPMGMSDETISGLEDLQGIGRKTKSQRQAARKQRQTARKEKRHVRQDKRHVKQAARKAKRKARGGLFKAIALAPVRGAFSALLLLNFKDFAGRFKQAIAKGKESEVQAFAKKFGYKYPIFRSQVMRGATKHALGEINGNERHEAEGIGFVVTATAIATASAAIIAATTLLKKLGLGHSSDDSTLKEATDALAASQGVDTGGGGSSASNESGGGGGGSSASNESGGGGGSSASNESGRGGGSSSNEGGGGGSDESDNKIFGLPKPVVYVGAVGLLILGAKKMKLW